MDYDFTPLQTVNPIFLARPPVNFYFFMFSTFLYKSYGKPIDLKFKANPEIPILHVVNTMRTNFQSKILSPGLLPAI